MPRFDLLNQLANFLDDLPHDRFHMPIWCSDDSTKKSCGTAGCACGWAATILHNKGWKIQGVNGGLPWYKDDCGHSAFATFFEISIWDAYVITCCLEGEPGSYVEEYGLKESADITPRHAADRIRKVITKLGGEVTEDYPVLTKAQPTTVGA